MQTTSQATLDAIDEKTQRGELVGMLEALAYTIHKIACEVNQWKVLISKRQKNKDLWLTSPI